MIRAIVVSDLHFGGEDRSALIAAAEFCDRFEPDLVLVAGDVSSSGRRREMRAAAEWLRSLNRPVVATPGNHDAPYWSPFSRVLAPFRRFDRLLAFDPPSQQSAIVRTLNTARGIQFNRLDWSLGVVDLRAVEQIGRDFVGQPPEALRVVLAHHPLAPPPGGDRRARTIGAEAAVKALVCAGADLIITGHLHLPFIHEISPLSRTWAIGAGTLSLRVRGSPPSFLAFEGAGPGTLRVQTILCADGAPHVAESATLQLRSGRFSNDGNAQIERGEARSLGLSPVPQNH